jgi:hypothetical protein
LLLKLATMACIAFANMWCDPGVMLNVRLAVADGSGNGKSPGGWDDDMARWFEVALHYSTAGRAGNTLSGS